MDLELKSNKINTVLEAMDAEAPQAEIDAKRLDLCLFLSKQSLDGIEKDAA